MAKRKLSLWGLLVGAVASGKLRFGHHLRAIAATTTWELWCGVWFSVKSPLPRGRVSESWECSDTGVRKSGQSYVACYLFWECSWISLSLGVMLQGLEALSSGLTQVAEELVAPHSAMWPPWEDCQYPLLGLGKISLQRSKQAQEDIKGARQKMWTCQLCRQDFWGDRLTEIHQAALANLHDARPVGALDPFKVA